MRLPRLPRHFTLCFMCTLLTAALAMVMAAARASGTI
jgi:hypothetical protein